MSDEMIRMTEEKIRREYAESCVTSARVTGISLATPVNGPRLIFP